MLPASITSGFCTDVTLDVHFQGATLTGGAPRTQAHNTVASSCLEVTVRNPAHRVLAVVRVPEINDTVGM